MNERLWTDVCIHAFHQYLVLEEKSTATMEKYLRDIRGFAAFAGQRSVNKELAVAYKKHLVEAGYAVRSVNSMLASVNSFLSTT